MKLWTKKKSYILRLLSAIICLLVLASVVPFQMLGAAFLTAPEVSVTVDGAAVSEIILPQTDKITLTANASPEKRDTAFQWQILTGTQDGEWVNILDATAKELTLSYAVVESLLDNSGSVCLRASVQNGEYTGYSAPVAVTVHYNVPEDETALLSPAPQAIELRDAADESNSEYVHISINYLDSVTGRAIYTGFSAQIQKGTSYTNSVISPTYLGYAPCYNPDHPAIGLPDEGEVDASADASIIRLDIPESFDGDSYVVNVYYKPIKVLYAARYFFQNINDDFYSEDLGLYKQDYATTGTIISNKQLEASDPDKTQGFTKLYHYPEAVAADGSTVFECYYDRNYYILNFDMNGGYGTEPVYARYGAPFLTTEPTRHGYTFVGWDLLEDGVGDGSPDPLPSTIPAENQTYKAIWQPISTQYTTVYWIQNADDDKATLSEDRLIPTTANLDPIPKINVFYAKFLPTYGDLTITRQNGADGQSGGEQTFVYKLTSVQNPEHVLYASITGNGSAVIKNLPCGDYVIEQVNGWSWRYSDGKKTVSLPQEGCSVRFDAEAENESWLNANSKKNQNRKG